jgi:hypothetical protein
VTSLVEAQQSLLVKWTITWTMAAEIVETIADGNDHWTAADRAYWCKHITSVFDATETRERRFVRGCFAKQAYTPDPTPC